MMEVSCFLPNEHRFIDYPGKELASQYNAHALYCEGDDLWIGTYAEGLKILNTRSGKIKEVDSRHIFSILKDSTGNIWLGSTNDICRYDADKSKLIQVIFTNAVVIDIKEDSQGNIWFATSTKGLLKYNCRNSQWQTYDTSKGLLNLFANVILIYMDKKERLWVGTEEGLCRYIKEEDRFCYVPLAIPNEAINYITENDDYFWITTGKGLVQYHPDRKTIQLFTLEDGLQGESFIHCSGIQWFVK